MSTAAGSYGLRRNSRTEFDPRAEIARRFARVIDPPPTGASAGAGRRGGAARAARRTARRRTRGGQVCSRSMRSGDVARSERKAERSGVEADEVRELAEHCGELLVVCDPLGLAVFARVCTECAHVLRDVRTLDEQGMEALAEDVDSGAGGLRVPLVGSPVRRDVDAREGVPATGVQEAARSA